MNMTRKTFVAVIALTALTTPMVLVAMILAAELIGQIQAPPTISTMYTLVRQRDDFIVSPGVTSFQTNAQPRSNYVEVFRNGLLQRGCFTCDYTGIAVTGAYRITFIGSSVPGVGDYVTLFYYR